MQQHQFLQLLLVAWGRIHLVGIPRAQAFQGQQRQEGGNRMAKAKLIMCNVSSTSPERLRKFYATLLGDPEFVRSPSPKVEQYYTPISEDGIDLTITSRMSDMERVTPYFAVPDLDEAIKALEQLGGTLLWPKERSEGELKVGQTVVMLDPDGNHVGLTQLATAAHRHFRFGRYRRQLDRDQLEDIETGHEEAKNLFG
jgi:predicted enzyme related to lactoylglutathione lyase